MGVGETVREEEMGVRKQMEREEEVEVRVGTRCCGFGFCPETMIVTSPPLERTQEELLGERHLLGPWIPGLGTPEHPQG